MKHLIQSYDGSRTILASEEQMKEMQRKIARCSVLYFVICGAAYNCAQSAMVDAYEELKQTKWWRQGVKHGVKQALAVYDRWNRHVKETTDASWNVWLDTTDAVYDEMRPHIQKLFFTVDAVLMRNNASDHRMKAHMVTAMTMIEICCDMHDQAMSQFRKQVGAPIRATFGRSDFNGVRQTWLRACEELFRQSGDPTANFSADANWRLAVEVVRNKFDNQEMYNRAASYALDCNPEHDTRTEEERRKYADS